MTSTPGFRNQRRGDQEIWCLYPFDRTLTGWRRQPSGTYDETISHGGIVRPASLPGAVINLDELFV